LRAGCPEGSADIFSPPISVSHHRIIRSWNAVNTLTQPTSLDFLPDQISVQNDDVSTQVWALLTSLYPQNHLVERRREHRYPFPYLIRLTSVAEDGFTPEGETVVVVGKHLSQRGVGFYHPRPLPHRRMIVSLEAGEGCWLSFLIDLTWCRFTEQHWYESGGRFIQAVATPPETEMMTEVE
jgi:hypothetical protein